MTKRTSKALESALRPFNASFNVTVDVSGPRGRWGMAQPCISPCQGASPQATGPVLAAVERGPAAGYGLIHVNERPEPPRRDLLQNRARPAIFEAEREPLPWARMLTSASPKRSMTPLRLLLIEDSEDDAALTVRLLSRAGYAVTS